MAYFRHLPDILYQSPLSHKNSSADYIAIKNIFRRTKLKDYLAGNVNVFNKYIIEMERDQIPYQRDYMVLLDMILLLF